MFLSSRTLILCSGLRRLSFSRMDSLPILCSVDQVALPFHLKGAGLSSVKVKLFIILHPTQINFPSVRCHEEFASTFESRLDIAYQSIG